MTADSASRPSDPGLGPGPGEGRSDRPAGVDDCWHRIGVSGDRSCPELNSFIHCRNCPVFAAAARTFFDRPAPEGYLAEWTRWLAGSDGLGTCGQEKAEGEDDDDALAQREGVSVLIFRL